MNLPLRKSSSFILTLFSLLAAIWSVGFHIHKEECIENVRSLLHRQSQYG
jgi:hypothetical protein